MNQEGPMSNEVFESAAQRISFSEAADFIEQDRCELIPAETLEDYESRGLLAREGQGWRLTETGVREHELAMRERFNDG
jgi:coproporphyrinogen III oxidase-like Fe-S oxidoreductase